MIFEIFEIKILQNIVQTKSAPNPDDMQNTGGDIMKKFAAVVKYKADDSIHHVYNHCSMFIHGDEDDW